MREESGIGARPLTRREALSRCGMGFGAVALANLIGDTDPVFAQGAPTLDPLAAKKPHFPGRAKRVLHLFMNGGVSQVDSFDPKPALRKYAGKSLPIENPKTQAKTGAAMPSPWKFRNYGESGIEVSDLFPHIGQSADDLCVIRSMVADLPNHEPSLLLMNCGEARLERPSMGAWVTYGLGTGNQNLPGFVVLCPRGYPLQATRNWRSAFLPGVYQGTYVDSKYTDIDRLIEHVRNQGASLKQQRQQLDLLKRINREHRRRRPEDARLEARIQSFELAYRMQMEASDAFDVRNEPAWVREMYGPGMQAQQMVMARRLLERGVRFVQVWTTGEDRYAWDHHEDLVKKHRENADACDRPIGALLKDLKQRGMLEDTLVVWTTEFGRTPTVQLPKATGRDHNQYGFSIWMAGAGIKGGTIYGATDEYGYHAVEKPVHVHDLHATILHLLGFNHEEFTYRHAGRDFRLTDVRGRVVKEIIA